MNKHPGAVMTLPLWKEVYDRMGVTPQELYMRQQGGCWLESESGTLWCTDGADKAPTERMLNPTVECMHCICSFMKKTINEEKGG